MYQQAAANNNPALLSFTRGERGTQQRRHVPAVTAALGVATLPADKHKSNVFHRGGQHVAFRRLLVLLGDDQCVAVDRLAPSLVYLLDCRDEHDGRPSGECPEQPGHRGDTVNPLLCLGTFYGWGAFSIAVGFRPPDGLWVSEQAGQGE